MPSFKPNFTLYLPLLVWMAGLTVIFGCANGTMRANPGSSNRAEAEQPGRPAAANPSASAAEDRRLLELWERRAKSASSGQADYPIGPGDVLTISVPQVEEITERKVRVSTQGTIELPLVGIVQAAGLTEDGLAQLLDVKLQQYMFKPQATVFVDEYRNRQVAVVGAVNKPGLIVVDSPAETILDVLTQAGGVAPNAADELVLIPGDEATPVGTGTPSAAELASSPPDSILAMTNSTHAVSISLRSTSLTGNGRYLELPVRPGDVIVIPGGGQVMVVGWVQNPGHFAVGSGLTVLGAIGEAGGPMYAANTKSITLIRSEKDGTKSTTAIDLEQIAHGQMQDPPVKANDVVDVPYSDWRIGPYIFYSVVARIGIAGPAIPF